ncbi:CpaF family protein [Anaerolineales bacterium HSG6]|nr:CpaF family protein [Anaerolineales bacterium HSG6]MDM8531730.1 CpaF family protein [Anaerolineales bacterium HSG25]
MALTSLKRKGPAKDGQKPARKPIAKKKASPKKSDDPLAEIKLPLESEPDGTPIQRGLISEGRAERLKLQLWLADNLRKSIAPDVPLDLPLERTPEREEVIRKRFDQVMQRGSVKVPPDVTQEEFYSNVCDEIFGFGPLEMFIRFDAISEIMVNGPYILLVESKGRIHETGQKFLDDEHVERIVKRIVKPLGRVASPETPLIDARLPDGSRVNSVIRPCAIDGPNLTIRKFSKDSLGIQDLINFGSLTPNMAKFLEAAVISRLNMVVSGGTGSGKTTLINVLSSFIPSHERTVTIEDAAELQFKQRNVVRLETKKSTPESPGIVTIRDCVINALRMRPERIVIGECRGGETLDMLQAMNTGHDGSMTTVHANDPRSCFSRLESLVLMAGVDFPIDVVRKQIANSVDMIIQASRLRDGSRKITHITEIQGMEGETPILMDIFKFEDYGDGPDGKIIGAHEPGGIRPKSGERLKQAGFEFPPSMFMKQKKKK